MILGARAPACLEWARAFAGAGWHVTVADSLSWPLARSSRSAHAFLRLPEPRRDVNAWIKALLKAIQAEKIDLVLPTCEEVFIWRMAWISSAKCAVYSRAISPC